MVRLEVTNTHAFRGRQVKETFERDVELVVGVLRNTTGSGGNMPLERHTQFKGICGNQPLRRFPVIPTPGIHLFVQSPSPLYQGWSGCPLAHGRSGSMSLRRLGYQRLQLLSWVLCFSQVCTLSLSAACHEDTQATYGWSS